MYFVFAHLQNVRMTQFFSHLQVSLLFVKFAKAHRTAPLATVPYALIVSRKIMNSMSLLFGGEYPIRFISTRGAKYEQRQAINITIPESSGKSRTTGTASIQLAMIG